MILPNLYTLNNNTSSQIELVYGDYPQMDYNQIVNLNNFLPAGENIFTTVSIEESFFKRTTEDVSNLESIDEFDIVVPLTFRKQFSKTVNIKSITKYVPKIIID